MAGLEVSHIIFFVGAVIIAVTVVGVINVSVQDILSASSSNARTLSEQMKTDIKIISDPDEIPADKIFYVKNVGSNPLDGNLVNVMIDGVYKSDSDYNLTVIGSSSLIWEQTDVLNITLDDAIASGDHTIKIITENGLADEMDFTI